ncbi:LLM class F420-dependent oxidoreductase [Dictyobacter aurantiacus]|uniref:LLM class F420-dependent oxidoreductase n=1 Tax=Dictyobacter aurantiacus TaxID=1936993 RepID=A0A401ZNC5_9CHLR|nr:LLM class F420-dependent oxidoreductase [Dictyobacter aurantiacus]GCE08387.1 LLM class F420-dependent oxidoreductase [Dictyobacter aurantiacus]
MQIGVTFPQTEIGADPQVIRDYAQAVEGMGYEHVLIYDHVLGANPSSRPGWSGYTHTEMFHEPFVLFGYLAALTKLELVTGVIILPQRQATLVAKQAAEVDVLSGGKFRLGIGVGWNPVEYEALGMDFSTRGRVVEEQIELMRQLWGRELITFKGKYHTVTDAGLNPLPVRRSIPVWIGGSSDVTLKRAARIADGWFPLGRPDDRMRGLLDHLNGYLQESGRERQSFGIEARVSASEGDLDQQVRETELWRSYGATHISFNTMNAGFTSLDQHLQALRRYKEAIKTL